MQVAASPLDYAHDPAARKRWIAALGQLIGFPTVSAQRSAHPHVERCAQWLVSHLSDIGMQRARVVPGERGGAPSVYAEWLGAPGGRTVLLYGHYDVQPAEPLAEWHTPPFRAIVRDGKIYGRGASDDKGQLIIHLGALESYLASEGRLPVNVKIWLEGEEEIMSPTLEPFLDRHGDLLRADVAVVSDTEIAGARPAIVCGLRGALPFELRVTGGTRELHSGRRSGGVPEPLQQLCAFVARTHDRSGRIAIPGFLAGIRERDPVLQPSLTVHGVAGGYTGSGWKAVVPNRALVRASARLAPGQDPAYLSARLAAFARGTLSRRLSWRLRIGRGVRGVKLGSTHPAFRAAVRAVRDVWGAAPLFAVSGGTIPIVEALDRRYTMPVVALGFGREDDRIHAADERFDLSLFFRGIDTMIRLLAELAK